MNIAGKPIDLSSWRETLVVIGVLLLCLIIAGLKGK